MGVIESIGTDAKFTSKYGGNGCPDKSANGMFTYAKNKGCAWGTIDTLPEIPGVALRSDGHVGVYVGGGYAVEERGFNYGCVKTKVASRKWTHWFQLPFVDYGDAVFTGGSYVKPDSAQTEYTLGTRTVKKGSKGTDVKALQEFLLQLEYSLPKYGEMCIRDRSRSSCLIVSTLFFSNSIFDPLHESSFQRTLQFSISHSPLNFKHSRRNSTRSVVQNCAPTGHFARSSAAFLQDRPPHHANLTKKTPH